MTGAVEDKANPRHPQSPSERGRASAPVAIFAVFTWRDQPVMSDPARDFLIAILRERIANKDAYIAYLERQLRLMERLGQQAEPQDEPAEDRPLPPPRETVRPGSTPGALPVKESP